MKIAKLKRDDQGLIASILQKKNDHIDKLFSDSHHIKSMFFSDDDKYVENFILNQDEHYSKIIEKFNDTQESI